MSYTTIGDVRQSLGLGDTPEYDYLLTRFIEEAQTMIETKTGMVFEASADTTRTLNAVDDVDGATLWLRGKLAAFAASNAVTNGDGVVVAPADYIAMPSVAPYTYLMLRPTSGLTWTYIDDPTTAIAVKGKWADYAVVPNDIRVATRALVAWLYRRRDHIGTDYDRAEVTPTGVTLLPPEWPPEVRAIVETYIPRPGAGSRVVRGRLVYS